MGIPIDAGEQILRDAEEGTEKRRSLINALPRFLLPKRPFPELQAERSLEQGELRRHLIGDFAHESAEFLRGVTITRSRSHSPCFRELTKIRMGTECVIGMLSIIDQRLMENSRTSKHVRQKNNPAVMSETFAA